MTDSLPNPAGSVLASTVIGGTGPGVATADSSGEKLSFDVSRTFCCDPLNLEFSLTPMNVVLPAGTSVDWDFGDGRTGVGSVVTHTYAWPGAYFVRLRAVWPGGVVTTVRRLLSLSSDSDAGTLIDVYDYDSAPGGDTEAWPGSDGSSDLIVDAGPEQTVGAGDTVILAGTVAANPDRGEIHYAWMQVSGPPVRLQPHNERTVTFTAPDVEGETDTLAFELAVAQDDLRASDEVRVTVRCASALDGANTPPIVFDQRISVTQGGSIVLALSGSDADGDELTFTVMDGPTHGVLAPIDDEAVDSTSWVYSPEEEYVGVDSFTYQATDGSADSSVATFTIQITPNRAEPLALDLSNLVVKNTTARLTLRGVADTGTDLTFTITIEPQHGTLGALDNSLEDSATVSYTPDVGYEGLDTFEFLVSHGLAESAPASVTLDVRKLLVPWMEVNGPNSWAESLYTTEQGAEPGMTVLDYCLVGLASWSQVTDTVIITTQPGQIENLYPELMQRKPSTVRIIGGIKTYSLPGAQPNDNRPYDFAEADGWQFIVDEVVQIAEITGVDVVVLENETALSPFVHGEESIDFARLAESLVPLVEADVQTWWWLPWIMPNDPVDFRDRQVVSTALVATCAETVPTATFLTEYASYYGWRSFSGVVGRRHAMFDLVGGDRLQEGLFVTPDGWLDVGGQSRRVYTTEEALDEVLALPGNVVRLYPGSSSWILVGREFTERLPVLAAVQNAP
ncbi:MAG: cadherin-like domain-containing protein [Phycisphaerales bacterium]|nr:MAG: cadherin-like domain-containing protein [Phycisphaerales bacterium]